MGQNFAQDICTRPRRSLLVAWGHVAWTHCAAHEMGFAAVPRSVALLCGTQYSPSFREVQHGLKLTHRLVRFITQARVHRRCVGDLAGIKDARSIPRPFDRAEE